MSVVLNGRQMVQQITPVQEMCVAYLCLPKHIQDEMQ